MTLDSIRVDYEAMAALSEEPYVEQWRWLAQLPHHESDRGEAPPR